MLPITTCCCCHPTLRVDLFPSAKPLQRRLHRLVPGYSSNQVDNKKINPSDFIYLEIPIPEVPKSWRHDSADSGVCGQAWCHEFDPREPCGRGKETTSQSCAWHRRAHTLARMQINKCNFEMFLNTTNRPGSYGNLEKYSLEVEV